MTPVSWFASWTETNVTSGSSSNRPPASISNRPSLSTGATRTCWPLASAASMTAGCSTALTTTGPGAAPQRSENGQVVSLGPSRGKRDTAGLDADDARHGVPRLVDCGPRRPSDPVGTRRIAKSFGQPGKHGCRRSRAQRCTGRVIKVSQHSLPG